MPLYEYKCTECHRITEKRQKFSDPEITECPHCHGRLERTISAPAVHFAGGGWYADLYSSKGAGKKDASAGDSGSNSGSGSGSGSEAGKSGETGSSNSGESTKAGEGSKSGSAETTAAPGKPAASTPASSSPSPSSTPTKG